MALEVTMNLMWILFGKSKTSFFWAVFRWPGKVPNSHGMFITSGSSEFSRINLWGLS